MIKQPVGFNLLSESLLIQLPGRLVSVFPAGLARRQRHIH
jgi:hypothetical protein